MPDSRDAPNLQPRRSEIQQWADDLLKAMSLLPVLQCAALQLVYFERLTQQQAAERACIPKAVFGSRLSSAMQALAVNLRALPREGSSIG